MGQGRKYMKKHMRVELFFIWVAQLRCKPDRFTSHYYELFWYH